MAKQSENFPQNVISFDPGFTTGVALYKNRELYLQLSINRKHINSHFLIALHSFMSPDIVLVEQPPSAAKFNVQEHAEIVNTIVEFFRKHSVLVDMIKPGSWKKMVKRSTFDSTHIKDATDMANWFIGGL